jgi:hypothetical protein
MDYNEWYYTEKFENAIYRKSAQSFEDFFCDIMKSSNNDFKKVKASGSIGDRKCDGFNDITGEYYQCYAPEDIIKATKTRSATAKINADINGLISKWQDVKKIYYVINDKFSGLSPEIYDLIAALKKSFPDTLIEIFSMEQLRKTCLSLGNSDKQRILGYCPDLTNNKVIIDFDTISNIIEYIEKNSPIEYDDNLFVPDFSEKIKINNLSDRISAQLNNAKYYTSKIDEFYDENPNYDKETLRNYIRNIYFKTKDEFLKVNLNQQGLQDKIFLQMLEKIVYNQESKTVIENALVILAFFFESCDIFEEPKEVINE